MSKNVESVEFGLQYPDGAVSVVGSQPRQAQRQLDSLAGSTSTPIIVARGTRTQVGEWTPVEVPEEGVLAIPTLAELGMAPAEYKPMPAVKAPTIVRKAPAAKAASPAKE